jgi:hypothetical protein
MTQAEPARTDFANQRKALGHRRLGEPFDRQGRAHGQRPAVQPVLVDGQQSGLQRLHTLGKASQIAAAQRRTGLRAAPEQAPDEAVETTVLEVATLRVQAGGELMHLPAVEQRPRH